MAQTKMSDESKFEKYLLSEYSNIAQAHFKSIETISTFFRYYLLIMSIPLSAIAIISRFSSYTQQTSNIFEEYKLPISAVLSCISLVGFWVFCYITNLRLDTILYARVVNGIRKYFYDESNIDINHKNRMRVLAQSPELPQYYEETYFLPVVVVFAIVNSLYLSFGCYVFFKNYWSLFIPWFFFISHWGIYFWYARHREHAYLKSNILGVDIDGVLNKHRDIFCSLLLEKTGRKIKPEEITVIPMHELPSLEVTREDEREVFNDPSYWKKMPVIDEAAENLRKLRNIFKLKIYIFTYRPWPDTKDKLSEYIKDFLDECEHSLTKYILLFLFYLISPIKKLLKLFKEKPLKQITKEWLRQNKFKYNNFVFEKGNDYSSDPRGRFNNRFYVARKKKIRFFVEDDLEKAIKLSYICDFVFLFDQPYNQTTEKISANIIRVKSWNEIYKKIRKLS